MEEELKVALHNMLACGNKVSPASLVTTAEGNDYISTELSGMESQLSQVSLFSGSDAGSSLELFSQPPPQADSVISVSTASCVATDFSGSVKLDCGDNSSQPPVTGSRKYYTKYLSLAKETAGSVAGNASVLSSSDVDPVSSKMGFDAWKDKQQSQLERKQIMKDMAAIIDEGTIKMNDNICALRDEVKVSMDQYKTHTETNSVQWEKRTFSMLTQMLHGQEESRKMMQEIRDELAQQRSLLSKLCTDTSNSFSTLIGRVIEDVRNSVECAAASLASVSTHNPSRLEHRDLSMAADQAVPTVPTIIACNEQSLYGDTSKAATECPRGARYAHHTDSADHNQQEEETPEKPPNSVTSQVSLIQWTGSKDEPVTETGKRKREDSPSAATKVPCGSGKKRRQKPRPDVAASRRSNRATRKPIKYMADYSSFMDEPIAAKEFPPPRNRNEKGSRIRRRVSVKQADQNCSQTCENTIKESPANALSDALYSETSAELPSSAQIASPITTRTDAKEKFQRRNEAAKRRKMVISSLTDTDLLLREIQDCILNSVDPSP